MILLIQLLVLPVLQVIKCLMRKIQSHWDVVIEMFDRRPVAKPCRTAELDYGVPYDYLIPHTVEVLNVHSSNPKISRER